MKIALNIPKIFRLTAPLMIMGVLAFTAAGQTLKADYQFQGNLNNSVVGATAMSNLTGPNGANSFVTDTIDGYSRQSLRFPLDSGVAIDTTGLIPNNTYTAVILFKMDDLTAYRRVLDATNGLDDDCGAYIFNSRFDGESTVDTNSILISNLYVQATIVRESTGRIRAYRDGRLKIDLPNDGGCFQILTDTLRFFQDDTDIGGEASAGNVARIRLYDAPMTDAQVRALDRIENAVGGGEQPILSFSDRDGNFEIYSMNADGSNQFRITNNSFSDSYPDWSPVRQKIAFNSNRDGNTEIYTMNLDGTVPARLTNNPATDYGARWSPDGSKILFSRCDAVGVCDLWVMNSDGTGEVNVTNTAVDDDHGQWSPDGTKIVFTSVRDAATYELYVMDANGTNVIRLTTNSVNDFEPTFSPNGSKIAFKTYRNGVRSEIYSMDANGSNAANLSNNNSEDSSPVWSPDGTKILFSSYFETATPTSDAGDEIRVVNANGSSVTRLTFNNRIDRVTDWRGSAPSIQRTPFDFDGDGRADISLFRPADSVWYLLRSQAGFIAAQFGLSTDKIAPEDYDGDGKTDIAVWRESEQNFYIFNSSNATIRVENFGLTGDQLTVGDWDGDGKADLSVYRDGAQSTFFYRGSLNNPNGNVTFLPWGTTSDRPQIGDFDGDGKSDVAVFRPSNATWYIRRSSDNQVRYANWGVATDTFVPSDYDGDGKTDLAVFRSGVWYILQSSDNQPNYRSWGLDADIPVPADYDGDGKTDVAIFRPSEGTWYLLNSTSGFSALQFGLSDDQPAPSAFIP